MKVFIFVMKNCPHTPSTFKMISTIIYKMKNLFPPSLIVKSGKTKTQVDFIIIEDNMEFVREFRSLHNLPLDSFPTIVKIDRKIATTYEGSRTKQSFLKFIK